MLTGSEDDSIIIVMPNGSEIEISVVELKDNQTQLVVYADEFVSVARKLVSHTDNVELSGD